jgi:glucose-1-phosphate cytidylyltransferase
MKVVLFCGGLGMRLREYSETIPKPLVKIGDRPIIQHLMKYYAHHGHTDFVLCLGYRGDAIKQHFLGAGGDVDDWNITFADTGLHANIGQRLRSVRRLVENEEMFLANYADQLSDLSLHDHVDEFRARGKLASFVAVRPNHTFHVVSLGQENLVTSVRHVSRAGLLINGGFFAFRPEVFDFLHEGEELVEEPFSRLIRARQLVAFEHTGFWACLDTFKDKQAFDTMYAEGVRPWEVWNPPVQAVSLEDGRRAVTAMNGRHG